MGASRLKEDHFCCLKGCRGWDDEYGFAQLFQRDFCLVSPQGDAGINLKHPLCVKWCPG